MNYDAQSGFISLLNQIYIDPITPNSIDSLTIVPRMILFNATSKRRCLEISSNSNYPLLLSLRLIWPFVVIMSRTSKRFIALAPPCFIVPYAETNLHFLCSLNADHRLQSQNIFFFCFHSIKLWFFFLNSSFDLVRYLLPLLLLNFFIFMGFT